MTYDTQLLPLNEESVLMAAELFRQGELVAFPTETVYGLGANALDTRAVPRIFSAKNRPMDNPLIVHIWDMDQLKDLCEPSENALKLMEAFWPGPLTVLCRKKAAVPDAVTAGLATVGVRMPSHPGCRAMLRACRLPIAAPSANLSGRPSPTQAKHVLEDMRGRIPLILDGGDCEVGLESTVLDASGPVPMILRPGAVTREMVSAVCGDCLVADSVMRPLRDGEQAPSPGMKHKHYAPRGKLTLYRGSVENVSRMIRQAYDASENAVILALDSHIPYYGDRTVMGMGDTLEDAAHSLFALLRQADERGYEHLFAETVTEQAVGLAVMNRLARAAGFDIVEV